MAFWDAWFKPKCAECAVVMDAPVEIDGRKICPDCNTKRLEAERKAEEERQARVAAEEAARARLEQRQTWGSDPRLSDG